MRVTAIEHAGENAYKEVMIDFGFTSDWLRNGRDIYMFNNHRAK